MSDLGLATGVVGFDDLRLAQTLSDPDVETVDAYGLLKYVRQVKSTAELDLLRGATRLNQIAIERTVGEWSAGMTWQEMIHRYHVQAVSLGGFVRDPGAIVVSNTAGPETAFFTGAVLDEFEIQPGMRIMWDCHGTWGQYCWDGGKTWLVDRRSTALSEGKTSRATAAAMGEIVGRDRPGATISSLQAAARETFRRAGRAERGWRLHLLPRSWAGAHRHGADLQPPGLAACEAGMVVSAHIQVPGDDRERSWLEEIMLVTPSGGEPFFTWGHETLST